MPSQRRKTSVRLRVQYTAYQRAHDEVYSVKLDGKGFPYVIFFNEKILIGSAETVQNCTWLEDPVTVTVLEGKEELERILANPDLTLDRVPVAQLLKSL